MVRDHNKFIYFFVISAFFLSDSVQDVADLWPYPAEVFGGRIPCLISIPLRSEWSIADTDSVPEAFNELMDSIVHRFLSRIQISIPYNDVLNASGIFSQIVIMVNTGNISLELGTNEDYTLNIPDCSAKEENRCDNRTDTPLSYSLNIHTISISAETIWGASHGLQTLLQLSRKADLNGHSSSRDLIIPGCPWRIRDTPRFSHRGLLLDTARHFLPVPAILRTLDAMAATRLNVLHWHIVDAQVTPINSGRRSDDDAQRRAVALRPIQQDEVGQQQTAPHLSIAYIHQLMFPAGQLDSPVPAELYTSLVPPPPPLPPRYNS
jgi:hypothetical protein